MSKVKCGHSEVDAHDGKMQQGPSTKPRAEASTRCKRGGPVLSDGRARPVGGRDTSARRGRF
jgi:hypothetical protein